MDSNRPIHLTMTELKGQELKDRAAELDIEGRSGMSADELRDAVAAKEAEMAEGDLSSEGQEALAEMDPVEAELAEVELDAEGPLHLESPSERIMTGAVNEEHAELQEERSPISEDEPYAGNLSEAGDKAQELEVKSDLDVVDYQPPAAELEERVQSAPRRLYNQIRQVDTSGTSGRDPWHEMEEAYQLSEVAPKVVSDSEGDDEN